MKFRIEQRHVEVTDGFSAQQCGPSICQPLSTCLKELFTATEICGCISSTTVGHVTFRHPKELQCAIRRWVLYGDSVVGDWEVFEANDDFGEGKPLPEWEYQGPLDCCDQWPPPPLPRAEGDAACGEACPKTAKACNLPAGHDGNHLVVNAVGGPGHWFVRLPQE